MTIHRLSYTSALVEGLGAELADTNVTIKLQHGGDVVSTGCQVRAVDPSVLSRLGIAVGVRVVFHNPIDELDSQFAGVIETVLREDALETRSTRRFGEGLLRTLTTTMNGINAASSTRTAFAGDVKELPVSMLVSMLGVSRKSGRLEIEHQSRVVTFEFANGRITNVSCPGVRADPRLLAHVVLEWTSGQFRFLADVPPQDVFLDLSVTALLLEHTRYDGADRLAG